MAGYLEKGINANRLIQEKAQEDLKLVITIPSYKEKDVLTVLESLRESAIGQKGVEVLVLINHEEDASPETVEINQKTLAEVQNFSPRSKELTIHAALLVFPNKIAGVGSARKAAMDEAVWRFLDSNQSDGVIACLDADCTVSKDYVPVLLSLLNSEERDFAYTLPFMHPLKYPGIMDYELHLRYFSHAIRYTGHPHDIYTVGSSMAVRMKGYLAQYGMNRRKAGEDFYFLQKFAKAGKIKPLTKGCVFPSGRVSDRVPFGTGKAVGEIIHLGKKQMTYHWKSFEMLRLLIDLIPQFYYSEEGNLTRFEDTIASIDTHLHSYLSSQSFIDELIKMKMNVTSLDRFKQAFFYWFDAFRLMKYLHHMRESGYKDIHIEEGLEWLNGIDAYQLSILKKEALCQLRAMDYGMYDVTVQD